MSDKPAPWDAIHTRAASLSPDRRACFALACAEHLVAVEKSTRGSSLREMLSEGWAAWSGQTGDLAAVLRALEPREGLDEDEVACVYYALDGVARAGPRDATIWASQRAIDAAYARVPRSEGAATFRPLDEDTAMPVVQSEFRWQDRVLQILETNADLAEAGQQVRS